MVKRTVLLLGVTLVSSVCGQEVSSCRDGVELTLFNEEVNFTVAVERCADLGAVIAPADSEEENSQLIALANESGIKNGIWIGAWKKQCVL